MVLPAGVWSVIVAHGGSHSNTVDGCLMYCTAPTSGGHGFMAGDSGTTVTSSHDIVYGRCAHAVNVGSGVGDSLGNGATITLCTRCLAKGSWPL
jgi:hypothetical protein